MGTPTATVFVDYSGTPHTFIKLDDGNGSVKFYGFAPQKPGSMMGAGTVGQDVTTHFKGDPQNKYAGYMDDVVWSKTIPLTSSQLTAMQGKVSEWIANKPDYNVFGTNCTAFVKDVLTAGGSGYAGITAGPNPLNLIPNSEQGPLFTTDINSGVKTLSDAVRNPSTTPGTPAYEYKQAHPEQFGPVTPTPSAKDPISYDLRAENCSYFDEVNC